MIEVAKVVLLAFVFIHAADMFLADARYRRPHPLDRHPISLRSRLGFLAAVILWFMIRLGPCLYYGVELVDHVRPNI